MNKKVTAAPATAASNPQSELTTLLLDVLRGVDREVKTSLVLGPAAQAAVARYRDIAEDLAVLPENAISDDVGFTSAPR